MWSVLGAQRELEAQISVCFRVFEDIMIFEETYFFKFFFREKKIGFLKKFRLFSDIEYIFFNFEMKKYQKKM